MKWFASIALALGVAGVVLAFLAGGVMWPAVLGAACAGASVMLVVSGKAMSRDRAMRTMVAQCLDADMAPLLMTQMAEELGTPDVLAALASSQRRQQDRYRRQS